MNIIIIDNLDISILPFLSMKIKRGYKRETSNSKKNFLWTFLYEKKMQHLMESGAN
jgi:hypothetical protein